MKRFYFFVFGIIVVIFLIFLSKRKLDNEASLPYEDLFAYIEDFNSTLKIDGKDMAFMTKSNRLSNPFLFNITLDQNREFYSMIIFNNQVEIARLKRLNILKDSLLTALTDSINNPKLSSDNTAFNKNVINGLKKDLQNSKDPSEKIKIYSFLEERQNKIKENKKAKKKFTYKIVVTTIFFIIAFWVMISKDFEKKTKKIANEAIILIIGFWISNII